MKPAEDMVRTICGHMGADPEAWTGFLDMANIGLDRLIALMPADLAAAFCAFLDKEPSP